MKRKFVLLILALSLLLSGCEYRTVIEKILDEAAILTTAPTTKPIVEPFIGFSDTEVEDVSLLRQLEPETLQHYVSQYRKYNPYIYFEYLNDTERLLYHAYEYAMDEGMPYFWVDERLLEGLERSDFQVLEFLALDSALVEQNIAYQRKLYTVHGDPGETYVAYFVEDFTRERLLNKKQSIMQGWRHLLWMEDWETAPKRKVAEHIYEFLGTYVTYEDKVENGEFLYSALYQYRTNCDGYANAFALMCALADIPCIEINSDTPENEVGHTWNMVFLDNKWVYVDATGAAEDINSNCETRQKEWVSFGFPDELLKERVAYADLLPRCPEGLKPILHIPNGNIDGFERKVQQAFWENYEQYAIILVDTGDLKGQLTDDLATKLQCDLHIIHYKNAEGKLVYYLFNNDP